MSDPFPVGRLSPDPDRRGRHLAAARPVLQRRRMFAQVRGVFRWAVVVVIAASVGWLTSQIRERPPERPTEVPRLPIVEEMPTPPPSPEPADLSAVAWEMRAEQATDDASAARAFRLAGDRYAGESDLSAALRCYRNHLDAASADERAVQVDDHWLLITLKTARRKERDNALDADVRRDGDDRD